MKTLVIDPDIKKSGIAQYNSDSGRITYGAEDIGSLLSFCKKENPDIVYVEASWNIAKANLRKTQFNVSYASKQALHAGQNQGFGLAIVQLLKSEGFKVMEVNPIEKPKGWKPNGSWSPAGRQAFARQFGELKGINDDVRDAIFLLNHLIRK